MIQYWYEKHRELQRQRVEEGFDGFTLIELLIVIVVLGILAATVIFALGGITGNSAQAACNTDAKSVETAVAAYNASPDNLTNAQPAVVADLTSTGTASLKSHGGVGPGNDSFLQVVPNNSHYKIQLAVAGGNTVVQVATNVNNTVGTFSTYDSGATNYVNPCNAVS